VDCCKTIGVESLFDERLVAHELRRYRRKGPDRTTRLLIQAIQKEGVAGGTLIDIGAGVGAITHALLASGARQAVIVDASKPSLDAARQVAEADATLERLKLVRGDYAELASSLGRADIVTLDRVICCYEDMPSLVERSAGNASRLYGLVYPRDTWWVRLALRLLNLFQAIRRHPYRAFAHRTREVEQHVRAAGLERRYHNSGLYWQVALYRRVQSGSQSRV
jgi:magnesium-protoporphyrin O-methyltransferase